MIAISITLIIFIILFFIVDYWKALKFILFIYFFLPQSFAFINVKGLPLVSLPRTITLIVIIFYFVYKRKIDNVFNLSFNKLPYLDGILLIYFGYIIVSLNSGKLMIDSLSYTHALILDNFAITYIIYRTFHSPKDISQIINIVILEYLIISIYGIYTWLLNSNPYLDFLSSSANQGYRELVFNYSEQVRSGVYGRVQSTFYHPISYGGHLAIVCSLIIYQLYSVEKKLKPLYLITIGLIILNIIITNSRSPLIFLLIVVIPFFIVFKKNRILLIILPLVFYLSVGVFPQLLKINYIDTINSALSFGFSTKENSIKGSSIEVRMLQTDISLNYFNQSPLVGFGGTKIREIVTFQTDKDLSGAESFLFELLIETGLIGFFIYGFLFIRLIYIFLKIRTKSNPELKYISHLGLSLVIGFLVLIIMTGRMGTMFFFFFVITIYLMIVRYKTRYLNK